MKNKIPPPIVTFFFGLCIYFLQEYFPEFNLESLVTSGIFKYSRNPMYLGMVMILFGLALMFNLIGGIFFTLLFAIYITKYQIRPEEEVMERLFGEDFLKYKNSVRMWL
jgi:protein-S-isoprenylcysteine O-methyltransferase Ste14